MGGVPPAARLETELGGAPLALVSPLEGPLDLLEHWEEAEATKAAALVLDLAQEERQPDYEMGARSGPVVQDDDSAMRLHQVLDDS